MSTESINTLKLQLWVDRIQNGDAKAQDELIRAVRDRLSRLARKMLKQFPDAQRHTEVDDILQNSMMRLLRALQQVRPESVRAFFGLAAEQMRRELLDFVRHVRGPLADRNRESGILHQEDSKQAFEPEARQEPSTELDRWESFHTLVESLPTEEREVVGLIFYHGWTQEQVADLFQVSVRTIQRRWQLALSKLHLALHENDNDPS